MSTTSRFVFRSPMPAGARALWDWHARPGAFERLTPPWEAVALLGRSGERLEDGLRVTLGVGPPPFRLRWVAEHRDCVPGSGFRDVQISGPFALWDHHHRTRDDGAGASLLEDDLNVALPLHRWLRPVAEPALRRKLERMFRYRHAVTRQDLQAHAARPGPPLRVRVGGAGVLARSLRHFLTTGGHSVVAADGGSEPTDATVLIAPGAGEPGPPLEHLLREVAGTPHGRLIVAGERLPAEVPGGSGAVALHLGALVWPGTGWLAWARPLPGTIRRGSDAPRRWIARDDALGAILTVLRDQGLEGPIDAAHPEPASDAALAAILTSRVPRVPLPGHPPPAARLPNRPLTLAAAGYAFRHASLADALDHVLGRPPSR